MEELLRIILAIDSLGKSERLGAMGQAVQKLYSNDQLLLQEIAKANAVATATLVVLILVVVVAAFWLEKLHSRVKRLEGVMSRVGSGSDKYPVNALVNAESPITE